MKRLHDDDPLGVIAEHVIKLREILARLDAAQTVAVWTCPVFACIPSKGEFKGFWAITVRANWRVIFRFTGHHPLDVDYLDYH